MIIDSTYFEFGELKVPNLDDTGNLAALNSDISLYEGEILEDLLGYELKAEFLAAIEDNPAQKWIDLRDGAEFTFDFNGKTITRKWIGFKNSNKISLLAYYTFAYHIRRVAETLASIGMVQSTVENAIIVGSSNKMTNAWNKFIKQYGEVPRFFDGYYDSNYVHYDDSPSVYNFLVANSDDYDNWIFKRRGNLSAI